MKIFMGTKLGVPLSGRGTLFFGSSEVDLDQSVFLSPGAIIDNRLVQADLTRSAAGRLLFTASRDARDERALVVVDLACAGASAVQFRTFSPNRGVVRVLRVHTLCLAEDSPRHCRLHALLGLPEGGIAYFRESVVSQPWLHGFRQRLGCDPKPRIDLYSYRFEWKEGFVSHEKKHSLQ